jgi:hypothetical protein
MTCIVGLVEDGTVYMGSDRQYTRDKFKTRNNSPKIAKKGPFTIAGAGSGRGLQLMTYGVDLSKLDLKQDEFLLVIELANELQTANREAKHHDIEEGTEWGKCQFLVGINNRLFIIESNYYSYEIFDFITLGYCCEFSNGVLEYIYEYDKMLDPTEKIMRTMELTEKVDTSVSGPFDIIEVV